MNCLMFRYDQEKFQKYDVLQDVEPDSDGDIGGRKHQNW